MKKVKYLAVDRYMRAVEVFFVFYLKGYLND